MPFQLARKILTKIARRYGYVPLAEMQAAVANKDKVERQLRHETRNLEHQISLRAQLEKQVEFLREMTLLHARKESATQQAVNKLEEITAQLSAMMQDTWPAAVVEATEPQRTAA